MLEEPIVGVDIRPYKPVENVIEYLGLDEETVKVLELYRSAREYIGDAMILVTVVQSTINYTRVYFTEFNRDGFVYFVDPILFVLEEFYPNLIWKLFDKHQANIVINSWYGISGDYWYYLVDYLMGDLNQIFIEHPIEAQYVGLTATLIALFAKRPKGSRRFVDWVQELFTIVYFGADIYARLEPEDTIARTVAIYLGEFVAPAYLQWACWWYFDYFWSWQG